MPQHILDQSLADVLIGVRCPEDKRQGAMRESRGLAPEALAAFDSWQWPAERKLAACDLIVDNDAGLDGLDLRARELLDALAKLRQERSGRFRSRLAALLDAVAGEKVDLPEDDADESELDWEEDET